MRKNKMMRAASGLLVATLLTTSVISGTFAKYVTQDSATDTARVAKWGVVAAVSGDLFGATYKKASDNGIMSYTVNGVVDEVAEGTVSSFDKGNVVAPGTKNDTGMTLYVKGTPEVSTKVIFDAAEDADADDYVDSDIYLKSGSYGVMVAYDGVVTKENYKNYYMKDGTSYKTAASENLGAGNYYELHDSVTANTDHYPLVWKVKTTSTEECKDVAELKSKLEGVFKDKKFKPNEENALSATVTWEWKFGEEFNDSVVGEKITDIDKQDTILGNMIAEQIEGANVNKYDIVYKKNSTDPYQIVSYETVEADLNTVADDCANEIVVAYFGDTYAKTNIVACLTVSFNARITVEQVD